MARCRVVTAATLLVAFTIPPALAGCAVGGWNGRVERWGGMKEVLHDGKTERRVGLAEVTKEPHVYGVGAVEGLAGEIVILDGEAWVARREGSGVRTARVSGDNDAGATLLVAAGVPRWSGVTLDRSLVTREFEDFLATQGETMGLPSPFPFVVTGTLDAVEFHVVDGRCPMGDQQPGGSMTPAAAGATLRGTEGTLVGFFAEDMAGLVTHHGSRVHVHVLIAGDGPEPRMGHVDSLTVHAGAVVRFPVVR